MKITYAGVHLAVHFEGVRCENGKPVEFPTAIALRALEQDCWVRARRSRRSTRTPSRDRDNP